MLKLKKNKREEKQAANQQLVKETNLTLIFNLINRYGPVSRADLAHITGLSPTTVSSLAEELIKNDIIIETGEGTTATSGRKPIMLEVNPAGGYIASIEMIESGFIFSLYDLKCSEVYEKKYKVSNYNSIGLIIAEIVGEQLRTLGIEENKLFGICLGVPGLIDVEKNCVITSTVIPIDENNNFYHYIKDRFKEIPVFLGNESWFSAYAEKEFGIDSDIRNLIFIDINVGVGAGIILNGQIFTGFLGLAGEIGHMSIDMDGPVCKCGNRGCLETMVSIPAIIRNIIYEIESGKNSVLKEMSKCCITKAFKPNKTSDPNNISNVNNVINNVEINPNNGMYANGIDISLIQDAFERKDDLVMNIIELTARRLAFGITNIINLVNPEVVVIGGEITKLGPAFLEKTTHYLENMQLKPNKHKIKVKYSTLKGNTVTLGGAKYVLDNILNTGILLEV
ncbi:MAG TPA: ROK family protein [Clostridiales bacterium]|nr:ROK family protein [Clostridiales bacterium]